MHSQAKNLLAVILKLTPPIYIIKNSTFIKKLST